MNESIHKGSADPRITLLARLSLTLLAILVAYHYSIETLVRGLALATPLSYLGLVPFIALALALLRAAPGPNEPKIHDRQVDYIVGLPLLLVALVVVWALPVQQSIFFWVWRMDLLSLPIFVAGVVAIVFGVRVLWRIRTAVVFLLLAWPLPYVSALGRGLQAFTDSTLSGLGATLQMLPLARPVGGDGSLFAIVHNTDLFVVSVVSACSGVNGFVGFLIVGTAFVLIFRGQLLSKIAWLATGLLLTWIMNLARILIVFGVGSALGESVALDWLHPFLGLLMFNLGVLIMALIAPRFGLTIGRPFGQTRLRLVHRPAVVAGRAAIGIVAAASLMAWISNTRLQQFELVAHDVGTPRLSGLRETAATIPGWSLQEADSYPWARQFFGDDAVWIRSAYSPQRPAPGASVSAAAPVVMDVISTPDRASFATFGLEACYQFHHYQVADAQRVALAGGVVGHLLAYDNPADKSSWLVVYWEWPVLASGHERYERVLLSLKETEPIGHAPVAASGPINAAELAISGWLGGTGKPASSRRLQPASDFLVSFAQQVIMSAAAHEQRAGADFRGGSG
jgi:exosortase